MSFNPKRRDVATALALLTRLPVNARFDRAAHAAWAYPIAGLAVALIAGAVATIGTWLGLGASIVAVLATAAGIVTTGAMHEDGLADTADGFWGGWDMARRLEIMRDSRIGTYGVLALCLAIAMRYATLSTLANIGAIVPSLFAAAVLSRAAMPYVMALLPHARHDGLSVSTGRPPRAAASLAAALALIVSSVAIGFVPTVVAAVAAVIVTATVIFIARRKIGGQTGDVIGATQILVELSALATFSAFAV